MYTSMLYLYVKQKFCALFFENENYAKGRNTKGTVKVYMDEE